jgi:hypothetical protein
VSATGAVHQLSNLAYPAAVLHAFRRWWCNRTNVPLHRCELAVAAGQVRQWVNAEVGESLGDAESSLGDAKSSLGDAKSSLGDAESLAG